MKLYVLIDNTKIWFRSLQLNKPHIYEKACPICLNIFVLNDKVYFILNNYELFPNRTVHIKCVEKLGGFTNTALKMKKDYAEALKYKHWF